MRPDELTSRLKRESQELGFSLCGVAAAVTPAGLTNFDEWLRRGYDGDMAYLADRREAYQHPDQLLDGARSVLMLAMDYRTAEPAEPRPGQGRVARYAWGSSDYHDVIRPKLHQLADRLREWSPEHDARGVIDTAPLLEREFAQLAGLGWIGKNTLLLSPQRGSWFFLAALVTDAELTPDEPHATDHCGTCTACLDACPTDAFVEPRVLDASRCISYLTIESRDLPDPSLREGVGDWLFGCDVCQEVCPWNRHAPESGEPAFEPIDPMNACDVLDLFALDEEAFRSRFRKAPLWRPKRRGLLRNAAVVLGNTRPPGGVEVLALALSDPEPLVRASSAWALGRYRSEAAAGVLRKRETVETDEEVLAEIRRALEGLTP